MIGQFLRCKICGRDVGDIGSICIECGAKGDATRFMAQTHLNLPREYFIGDISGLTEPERKRYMKAFDQRVELLKTKASNAGGKNAGRDHAERLTYETF